MRINPKSVALGLTVGLLAGGAGTALAATIAGRSTAGTSVRTKWGGIGAWGGYGSAPGWNGSGGYPILGWYRDVGDMTFGRTAIRAAAGYLALSTSGLKSRLRSDHTLADLAISQHKSVSGLESAIVAAISTSVNSDAALSTGQKAAIIADAKEWIGSLVENTCSVGTEAGSWRTGAR